MSFHLILILLFCLISAIPAFKEYTREWTPTIKNKNFWIYSWSGHALLLASAATLLKILEFDIGMLNLLAGTTMLVSGYGFTSLTIISRRERGTMGLSSFKILTYSIHHLIMAFLGVWLLFTTQPTYFDVLLTIMVLLLYARLMIPKGLEVPWILYKKSAISLKLRERIISMVIILLYILLPSLSLLV